VFVHVDELIVRVESRAACVRFPTWKYPVPYCAFIRERILLSLSSEQHDGAAAMTTTSLTFLNKHAIGLNLSDSEDRAIFRERVAFALRGTTLAAMREWTGAKFSRRAEGANAVANAYLDTCTATARWAALVAKAEALGTNSAAFSATMDAECNARDTLAENGRRDRIDDPHHADEQAGYALGSLCYTTIFQENADVRAFFEVAGYRW
jgi:hypothetical protein